jgi:putative membrane protein
MGDFLSIPPNSRRKVEEERSMSRTIVAALAALGLGLAGPAAAQDRAPAAPGEQDHRFVFMASAAGLAEVNLGNLALKSASRKEVKDFAQHMVTDHTKANQELLDIVNRKSLRAAPQMSPEHRAVSDRLFSLSGQNFDRLYMQQMVKDHEEAVRLFEAQARNGQDKDLKAYAEKHLPGLRKHLDMARKLSGSGEERKPLPEPRPEKDRKPPPEPKPEKDRKPDAEKERKPDSEKERKPDSEKERKPDKDRKPDRERTPDKP